MCVCLEILNYRAGTLLPLAPLPPDARHAWRTERTPAGVALQHAVFDAACWLYPLTISLAILLPILAWKYSAKHWRVVLLVTLVFLLIAAASMIHRDYLEAFGRLID